MNESPLREPVLVVRNLSKAYPAGKRRLWSAEPAVVRAVDGVSFDLHRGEILGLVGESGCGKSTLALGLMNLVTPTTGEVWFGGHEISRLRGGALRRLRRMMQMIFQDPYEALNPTMRVAEIVEEPLRVHRLGSDRADRRRRVQRVLADVGLRPGEDYLDRYPHELSGGQRQRVAIAAALILKPRVLLADEPVSMLDVSIRAEILGLLKTLCRERGIAILLISHDLSTVAHYVDRLAVMYLGQIVERGPVQAVVRDPRHPYTRALLDAVPVTNPRQRRQRPTLAGETPNPLALPSGCRFNPRCPIATPHCSQVAPELREVAPGQSVACHEADASSADNGGTGG